MDLATGLVWSQVLVPRYRQWIEPAINLSCKVGFLGSQGFLAPSLTFQNSSELFRTVQMQAEVVATALAWRLQQVPLASPKIL